MHEVIANLGDYLFDRIAPDNKAKYYGIMIKLFFSDHPPPHFHVVYGEYNALFDIETLDNTTIS